MNDQEIFETTFSEDLYLIPPPPTVVIPTQWKDLSEQELTLLSKILESLKLSLSSVRIIEMPSLDLSQWNEKPSRLIGFGCTAKGIPLYEVITTPQTQLVLADTLAVLNGNDDFKKRLWACLKQLFSV